MTPGPIDGDARQMAGKNAQVSAKSPLYSPRVFSKRTRARFTADRTRQILQHLNREPSYPEKLILARVIALEWWMRRLDARLDAGEDLSGHAIRGRLAAETRLRLDLAALGLRPQAPPPVTLAEITAEIAARRGAAA
jgi:hypothetical protein